MVKLAFTDRSSESPQAHNLNDLNLPGTPWVPRFYGTPVRRKKIGTKVHQDFRLRSAERRPPFGPLQRVNTRDFSRQDRTPSPRSDDSPPHANRANT